MMAPTVTKRSPHPNALSASNGKKKFRIKAANNPRYREPNEPVSPCAVNQFERSMTTRIDPITIEFTIHVAPKRIHNVVTTLVAINRKLAPMKNKSQLTIASFRKQEQ